jgi:hypothetical protein
MNLSKVAAALAALAIWLPQNVVEAQRLPFRVTVYDWERPVREQLTRIFRGLAAGREVLLCVESWRAVRVNDEAERVVIERVRSDRVGSATRIGDVGDRCLDETGRALPMVHTHDDGNCQFSPADLITAVARGAAFEGIQCGTHHFVWTTARDVLAIATQAERESKPPQ